MKWFKRKTKQMIEHLLYEFNDIGGVSSLNKVRSSLNDKHLQSDPVLNFKIYSVNNGHILEFRSYDAYNDKAESSVYIINKDEDIAERVAKCFTREFLR
jgi:hypothetical protein